MNAYGSTAQYPIDITCDSPDSKCSQTLIDLTVDDQHESGNADSFNTQADRANLKSTRCLDLSEQSEVTQLFLRDLPGVLGGFKDIARMSAEFTSRSNTIFEHTRFPSSATPEAIARGMIRFVKTMKSYDITSLNSHLVRLILAQYIDMEMGMFRQSY